MQITTKQVVGLTDFVRNKSSDRSFHTGRSISSDNFGQTIVIPDDVDLVFAMHDNLTLIEPSNEYGKQVVLVVGGSNCLLQQSGFQFSGFRNDYGYNNPTIVTIRYIEQHQIERSWTLGSVGDWGSPIDQTFTQQSNELLPDDRFIEINRPGLETYVNESAAGVNTVVYKIFPGSSLLSGSQSFEATTTAIYLVSTATEQDTSYWSTIGNDAPIQTELMALRELAIEAKYTDAVSLKCGRKPLLLSASTQGSPTVITDNYSVNGWAINASSVFSGTSDVYKGLEFEIPYPEKAWQIIVEYEVVSWSSLAAIVSIRETVAANSKAVTVMQDSLSSNAGNSYQRMNTGGLAQLFTASQGQDILSANRRLLIYGWQGSVDGGVFDENGNSMYGFQYQLTDFFPRILVLTSGGGNEILFKHIEFKLS